MRRAAIFLFILAALTSVGVFLDPRVIAGQNIWIKPLKFSFSVGVFLLTVGWIVQYLPRIIRVRYSITFVSLMAVEILAIYIQAFRGRPSHHNFSTPLDGFLYGSMGYAIALNTVLLAALCYHITKNTEKLPGPYVRSIQYGLVLSVMGSLVGAIMSANRSHSFGGADGGPGIPFFNWSTVWGDLRFAHFIGLHGLQILFGLGFLLSFHFRSKISEARSHLILAFVFLVLFAVTLAATVTALQGLPFYYPLELNLHTNFNDPVFGELKIIGGGNFVTGN